MAKLNLRIDVLPAAHEAQAVQVLQVVILAVCRGLWLHSWEHAVQVRRAGAMAVATALQDKEGLQLLALNENEISDAAIDDMKVSAHSRFLRIHAAGNVLLQRAQHLQQ